MTLRDLKDIIPGDNAVGIIEEQDLGLPCINSWDNWVRGCDNIMDSEVIQIQSRGFFSWRK